MGLQSTAEKLYIEHLFEDLMRSFRREISLDDIALIERAFKFANKAHLGIKKRSGDPFIVHPIAVAKIVVKDIGLGPTSAIAAILHDVVNDTDYTLDDINTIFGSKVASIIDMLSKVNLDQVTTYDQVTNFKKMLLTLSEDIRVVFIQLADRLHNMRSLDYSSKAHQIKIADDTLKIYAPLAHRLGLNRVKSELEDISFKYKDPEIYRELTLKIDILRSRQTQLIEQFCTPIKEALNSKGIEYTICSRMKSPYSTFRKMEKQSIKFEEVFDLIAIRIIFKPREGENERTECFAVYSALTDIYRYNKQGRFRDWINSPKSNGYMALHDTLKDHGGNWFEVQIRSENMDRVAERGVVAHHHYKNDDIVPNSQLEEWLHKIKQGLDNSSIDALDLLDDFRLDLYHDDIVVFTPKGDMKTLPKSSTVIDLAYDIHSNLGDNCIGAKVNKRLVPATYTLNSGDQVEILTSSKVTVNANWIDIVKTPFARHRIQTTLTKGGLDIQKRGRDILQSTLQDSDYSIQLLIRALISKYKLSGKNQLYNQIGLKNITSKDILEELSNKQRSKLLEVIMSTMPFAKARRSTIPPLKSGELYIIDDKEVRVNEYIEAECCNLFPGDAITGVVGESGLTIHKNSCSNLLQVASNKSNSIVKLTWKKFIERGSQTTLNIVGYNRREIIRDITTALSKNIDMNIESISLDSSLSIFRGEIKFNISNSKDVGRVISSLKLIDGVSSVTNIVKEQV